MKNFKPIYVVLFTLGVFILLSPLVYFAPKDGWEIWGTKIKFLTQNEFFHPKKQEMKDITKIIADVDTTSIEEDKQQNFLQHQNGSNGNLGSPNGGSVGTESKTQLHLSSQAKENLIALFQALESLSENKEKAHILHYGDSQIEGDRMTAYIRQRLQSQFGGNGPGLIPAVNVYQTNTFIQRYSPNFVRYTCFGGTKLANKKYGVLGSAGRFLNDIKDSTGKKISSTNEGWIEISPGKMAYKRAKEYNNVKLYYTDCKEKCGLKVFQNGSLIHEDTLISDGKYHVLPLTFPSSPGKLRYVFNSLNSPVICGFSLEGDFGVQVDNIAMRGCSGTIFGSMDHQTLTQMEGDLNNRLVIMQFGGNAMPSMKDSSSVRRYARQLESHVRLAKKLNPNAMVILIGPSDMSVFSNGIYETYPLLPYCVEQLKKVAENQSAGYWDLFAAMGGKNSMPSWVAQGLASKDYIHFSHHGASIASQLFYEALIAEYGKWKAEIQ